MLHQPNEIVLSHTINLRNVLYRWCKAISERFLSPSASLKERVCHASSYRTGLDMMCHVVLINHKMLEDEDFAAVYRFFSDFGFELEGDDEMSLDALERFRPMRYKTIEEIKSIKQENESAKT